MGAKIVDVGLLVQAGINPKNGLPYKLSDKSASKPCLKDEIKKSLRILDEQDAVNRYKWFNLPNGLNGQLLERILYYRFTGSFFYSKELESFYFLPYALNGKLDLYGRMKRVSMLPFNSTSEEAFKAIAGMTREVVYDVIDETSESDINNLCVLLTDYTPQCANVDIPRVSLQEPLLDIMSEAFPLARTSLILNSGIKGVRVNDEDQQTEVQIANETVTTGALNGQAWIPIVGNLDFQELTSGNSLKSGEYLQYMQAVDNQRLANYGLKNGGVFEKDNTYVNTDAVNNIQNNVGLVYNDGLTLRQRFCDIVNSIWDLGIWCEPSECVTGSDNDMDGVIADQQDQSGIPQEQPQEGYSNVE